MSITNGRRLTTRQFIDSSNEIHNCKYDYSLVKYINSYTKVTIICPLHGKFEQTPLRHRRGNGCYNCGKISAAKSKSLGIKKFIERASILHNKKYDYSKVEYINAHTSVIIMCPIHGEFSQYPNDHLYGKTGCPKCSSLSNIKSVSLAEARWLDSFENDNIIRQYQLDISGKQVSVDGFDPSTNTVYEFYGSFWHGNPEIYESNEINPVKDITFGQLYENTVSRANKIRDAGYNLVEYWDK